MGVHVVPEMSHRTVSSVSSDPRSGDPAEHFRILVLPHLKDAYPLARWLTGNRTDADDVVQDACLRAFRGIGNFTGGNPRAWLLAIVRHAAYDWLGRRRRSAIGAVDDPEGFGQGYPDPAATQTPETILLAKDGASRLEAAISALPAALRETVVLRDLQGLAYREIAEVTGVPIGTVMSRLARAHRSLIATLAIRGDEQKQGERTTPPRRLR